MTCTPSEVPPEKRLLEMTTPLGPTERLPELVTVMRPSPHDEQGSMLSKVLWSMRMFALAMLAVICSVAVNALLAIVTFWLPWMLPPGIVTPLTVTLLALRRFTPMVTEAPGSGSRVTIAGFEPPAKSP